MKEEIRYLEIIQNTITRMAANSFAIKRWFVVSFGGILTMFFTQRTNKVFGNKVFGNKVFGNKVFVVGFIITLFFACLDAYYLYLERIYRCLYDLALKNKVRLFDMSTTNLRSWKLYFKSFRSFSMGLYLGGILILVYLIFQFWNIWENPYGHRISF